MLWANRVPAIPLFGGLTEEEKQEYLGEGKVKKISPREYLFRHGDPAGHFYIICYGTIKLFRQIPDGHEITTDILIAGNTIGEIEILESFPLYQSNAQAIEPVSVLQFPKQWLKDTAKKNGKFALNLLSSVAQTARLSEIEAEQQATMSAPQLIGCFLQRLCVLHDFNPKGFELPYSKTLIASRLGMELETFSRALAKLKDHGINVDGMNVVFDDFAKMKDYVCGHCSVTHDCPTHQSIQRKFAKK
ncbi:MAG: Crp/Fnr family transcriptional regulator [Alphaproteobacteria bacterium]|nr:MAG: Crp/Fnr family transcriptional regulator [Alphaproteobacteria bacterium]